MNMSDIMLEAFRQEWENLPPKTQQYYIERFREIAGDEPSQERLTVPKQIEKSWDDAVAVVKSDLTVHVLKEVQAGDLLFKAK